MSKSFEIGWCNRYHEYWIKIKGFDTVDEVVAEIKKWCEENHFWWAIVSDGPEPYIAIRTPDMDLSYWWSDISDAIKTGEYKIRIEFPAKEAL